MRYKAEYNNNADLLKKHIVEAIHLNYARVMKKNKKNGMEMKSFITGNSAAATLEDIGSGEFEIGKTKHFSSGKEIVTKYLNKLVEKNTIKDILALGYDEQIQNGTHLKKVLADVATQVVEIQDQNGDYRTINSDDKKYLTKVNIGTIIMQEAADRLMPHQHDLQHALSKKNMNQYYRDVEKFKKTEEAYDKYKEELSNEPNYAEIFSP